MIEWLRLQDDHYLHITSGTRVLIGDTQIHIYYPIQGQDDDVMVSFNTGQHDAGALKQQLFASSIPATHNETR